MSLVAQGPGAELVIFLLVMQSAAQSPVRPAFEAATIKPSLDSDKSGVQATTGRLTIENVPLRLLLSVAYKKRPSLIEGGPSWTDSAKFDVQGKADGAAGTDSMLLMLQTLLEDRFDLQIHREIRDGPVYELAIAKGGHRLKQATCVPLDPNRLPRQTAAGEAPANYCGRVMRGGSGSHRTLDAMGIEIVPSIGLLMPSLTGQLSELLDRTVINKTDLTGAFDFHLEWSPDQAAPTDDFSGPSIFTALQEQLGLRLQSGRGPVEFLVIDRAEKPSGN